MKKIWALTHIDLYQILCPPKVKGFTNKHSVKLKDEEVIYSQNQIDNNVYLVSNGKVKIVTYDSSGKEIIKQILIKGELFGEKIVLNQNKRDEFAIACKDNTQVCSMNIQQMKGVMRNNERFETEVFKIIGFKLKKVERRLELLVGKDVESRIASFIYDSYIEKGNRKIVNNLSHLDISKLLATSRESVTKTFNKLKHENIIDYTRKEILILNPERLKEMSLD